MGQEIFLSVWNSKMSFKRMSMLDQQYVSLIRGIGETRVQQTNVTFISG